MQAKDPHLQDKFGHSEILSAIDIMELNLRYGCNVSSLMVFRCLNDYMQIIESRNRIKMIESNNEKKNMEEKFEEKLLQMKEEMKEEIKDIKEEMKEEIENVISSLKTKGKFKIRNQKWDYYLHFIIAVIVVAKSVH